MKFGRPPRSYKASRTTVYISEDSKKWVFARASEMGQSISRVIEDLLRVKREAPVRKKRTSKKPARAELKKAA